MPSRLMRGIVIPVKKSGTSVKIQVLIGPNVGKEFIAKKVEDDDIVSYYVGDTYYLARDVIEI